MDVPYRLASRSSEQRFDWYDESTWSADDRRRRHGVPGAAGRPDRARAGRRVHQAGGGRRSAPGGPAVRPRRRQPGSRLRRLRRAALELEHAVKASGADWTIVRPAWFAQGFSEDFLRYYVLGRRDPAVGRRRRRGMDRHQRRRRRDDGRAARRGAHRRDVLAVRAAHADDGRGRRRAVDRDRPADHATSISSRRSTSPNWSSYGLAAGGRGGGPRPVRGDPQPPLGVRLGRRPAGSRPGRRATSPTGRARPRRPECGPHEPHQRSSPSPDSSAAR